MASASGAASSRVIPTLGLLLGVFATGVSAFAWMYTGTLSNLLQTGAFACYAVLWSKIPIKLGAPLWNQLKAWQVRGVDAWLTWTGHILLGMALALRYAF